MQGLLFISRPCTREYYTTVFSFGNPTGEVSPGIAEGRRKLGVRGQQNVDNLCNSSIMPSFPLTCPPQAGGNIFISDSSKTPNAGSTP
jgi:hypothetical protein